MIIHEVTIPFDGRDVEICEWLRENVGERSKYKQTVCEERPWAMTHPLACTSFYFARERDAALFMLRWL